MSRFAAPTKWTLVPVSGEKELDEVVALDRAAFTMPWSRDMFARAVNSSRGWHLYVARNQDERRLAGFICYHITDGELQIGTIAVRADIRRHGLGGRLVKFSLDQGLTEGVRLAHLMVRVSNGSARRLYERLGFVAIAVQPDFYHDPTEDALLYVWTPQPPAEP